MSEDAKPLANWRAEPGRYGTQIKAGNEAVGIVYSDAYVPLILNAPLLFHALSMNGSFLSALHADPKLLDDPANVAMLVDLYSLTTDALTTVDQNWVGTPNAE